MTASSRDVTVRFSSMGPTAPPNHLLRGYELINDAKTQLEAVYSSVVSCADVLALPARNSVALLFNSHVLPFVRDLRYKCKSMCGSISFTSMQILGEVHDICEGSGLDLDSLIFR